MTDLRFACRQLLKSPLFTVVAVTALGLAIGAATTAFGAFNSIRLKPFPLMPEQSQLVSVEQYVLKEPGMELRMSFPDYRDINRHTRSLLGVAVHQPRTFILTDSPKPERLLGSSISARSFEILGVRPLLG